MIMNYTRLLIITLSLLSTSCLQNQKVKDSDESQACPPLKYSDSFQAVFIEETSCGSLNDVDFVYDYVNGSCTTTKRMVDMSKYIREREIDTCGNGLKIFTYTKKDNE